MTNMSTLDRNIMCAFCALPNAEQAESMFLRLRNRLESSEAEQAAYEWAGIEHFLRPMFRTAEMLHDNVNHGVDSFIEERFYRRYAPGN